jgi:hypothetical protein
MIVGAFFSECGTGILGRIAKLDALVLDPDASVIVVD